MRLQDGEMAPAFSTQDIDGRIISPGAFAGRPVLLSFYRFASCPFCNLQVHELIEGLPELERRGLAPIAVFQSARERIMNYVGKQRPPFPVIADPGRQLYRLYGVESSWRGLVSGAASHLGRALKSMRMGFLPGPMDGGLTLIPADFLIDPDGRIQVAYYGRDISDHLPIATLLHELKSPRRDCSRAVG